MADTAQYESAPYLTQEWREASARRLNALAHRLGCKTYLEIGVCTGETFLSVDVEYRTGVDPHFQFDHLSLHDGNRIILLRMTSDDFFTGLNEEQKYDLIFLDGLHTYDQTYRDLQNALLHSHSGTVIMIDDTWPCDVFSTMRDMRAALHMRKTLSGGNDLRWHGDTYKIVPLLALFHTNHQFATIVDRGNPQTLLWRANQSNTDSKARQDSAIEMIQPFLALENLTACDYLWFIQNQNLYRPMEENEVLDAVFRERIVEESAIATPSKPLE